MNFSTKCLILPRRVLLTAFVSLLLTVFVYAQTAKEALTISVKADHADWVYKTGEKPRFIVTVLQNGKKPANLKIKYQVGPEKMKPFKSDSLSLSDSSFTIDGFTMETAGFLRCVVTSEVNGKTIKGLATAAFSPETIKPTIGLPSDFNNFWANSIRELSKIPLNPVVELVKESSTEHVSVYHISIQNIHGSKVYGMLCVPKKEGKYPAVLKVPGAGVRPYKGDLALAEKGVITLEIGIHGVPVNMPAEVYNSLATGALFGYPSSNLDNKTNYYYQRVYLGCVRALDFLVSQPAYDGKNLAVYGGSQGGALSIVTAALDSRVKYLGALYPALSDVTGYLYNRAGGWPHLFNSANISNNNTKAKLETCQYYDVVNFAKQLKVPGFYSWGFNDETCPPTSMYAAYNSISAPKELAIYKETGHFNIAEQREKMAAWLISNLRD